MEQKKSLKKYRNYFIGVSLDDSFLKEYKKVLRKLEKLSLGLSVSTTKFPHFTIIFMGNQDERVFSDINAVVKKHKSLLKGVKVTISGFDYFEKEHPRVVFVKVKQK